MKCDELKPIKQGSVELGEYWVYDAEEVDAAIAELKAEADKVIEELKADYKEACGRLQTANLIKDEQLAATRHSNYKRCLAMARWCCNACDKWMMKKNNAIRLGKDGIEYYHQARRKLFHYMKWYKRWRELAEKFKEAK